MELNAIGRKKHGTKSVAFLVLFVLVLCKFVQSAPASVERSTSDECDWFGSGLEDTSNRNIGVQPVYLRCREGVVDWQYPRKALRIILRLGQSNKDFQGCVKVTPFSSGATLYQEEPKRLKYLYGNDEEDEDRTKQICFKSVGGQVALYLEARGSENSLKKDAFRFVYDLEPMQKRKYSDCRPCSDRELLYLFCTSDFVARGFISSLYQNEYTQQTELTIHSHDILRDSETKVFHRVAHEKTNRTHHSGVLHRPLHCGTNIGRGEFLFIGRWRLGTPVLTCAPRWTEWKKIRQKAIESENFDCILD